MDTLLKVYTDIKNPASFSGLEPLQRATGAKKKDIDEFAENVDVYNKFKPVRKKFQRAQTNYTGLNHTWSCDTINLSKLAKYNNNIAHVLVILDNLSRFMYTRGLRTLRGAECSKAMESVILKHKIVPNYLFVDRGIEFMNKIFDQLCNFYGIHRYNTDSEMKSYLVERSQKTLKSIMWRFMYKIESWRYIDHLQIITDNYNSRVNRSIGFKPKEVTPKNEVFLLNKLNKGIKKLKGKPKFAKNDLVRLAFSQNIFQKGFRQTYTNETYIIEKVVKRQPRYVYLVKDQNGQTIQGIFYSEQLVKVTSHEKEDI